MAAGTCQPSEGCGSAEGPQRPREARATREELPLTRSPKDDSMRRKMETQGIWRPVFEAGPGARGQEAKPLPGVGAARPQGPRP